MPSIPLAPFTYDKMPYAGDGQGYRPGDWFVWHHSDNDRCPDWDNCVDLIFVVLPCRCLFSCSHRASNCTLPNDRLHRCWVISGSLPNITLSKAGLTCAAGAGSIGHEHWHGFIQNGQLVGSEPTQMRPYPKDR